MSGSKCIEYSVSHDGSGISYEIAYQRHELLLRKVERLQSEIDRLLAAYYPQLAQQAAPQPLVIATRDYGDAYRLVEALNGNQAAYRALSGELERLQEQAGRIEALRRLAVVNSRAAELKARIDKHNEAHPGNAIALPPAPATIAEGTAAVEIDRAVERQLKAVERIAMALEQAESDERDTVDRQRRLRDQRRAERAAERRWRESEAASLLARLDPDIDEAARQRVEAQRALFVEARTTSDRERARTALWHAIEEENRRNDGIKRAFDLLQELARFDTARTSAVRERLALVESGQEQLTTQLENDAKAILQEVKRQVAAKILADEFKRLGYRIAGDFATLCARGGEIYLQGTRWRRDYMCRIGADANSGGMSFDIVRAEGHELSQEGRKAADREVEEAFCADFHALLQHAKTCGLDAELPTAVAAGERPVTVVRDLPEALRGGADQPVRIPGKLAHISGQDY